MKKYIYYSLQDWVWDDNFRTWVLSPTPETNSLWHEWLSENPEKWDIVQEASKIVRALSIKEPTISDQEINRLVQKTIQNIEKKEQIEDKDAELDIKSTKAIFYKRNWFQVAASLALLIGLSWWFWGKQPMKENESVYENLVSDTSSKLIETINKNDTPQIVQLSDGSKATLKKGSRISYEASFSGDYRVVYLSGEAFFEVAKNPQKPFLVYANEIVTKVLGTSFTIKAYQEEKEVIVEVKTGQVSVSTKKSQQEKRIQQKEEFNGLVLTPNQKVIFNRQVKQLTKTLVDDPEIVAAQIEKHAFNFDFDDTPANDIFQILKEAYNINIVYDDALLKSCPVTAPLSNQPLFDKLNIICKAIGAQYEVLDGQIIIHSNGCK